MFTLLAWFVNDIVNQKLGEYFFNLNNVFDITLGDLSIKRLVEIKV